MIEFVTPALANYRFELFESLEKQYSIKFIFTLQLGKEFSGLNVPESWNYENIGIAPGVFHLRDTRNWLRLTRTLLTDSYNLVITSPAESSYNLLALLISKLRHKQIIFWGESWYWPSNRISLKIYNIAVKWMLEHGDAVIGMGEKQYFFYLKTLNKNTDVFCAPKYVVPYKRRDATMLLENLALEDRRILGKKIILYMSQIVQRKGLDYLVRAFKLVENKFDNAYLLVVGSGPFEEYCKKIAKELGIKNIMFKGYIQTSDVELYHNVCDVLVLPSIFLNDYPEPNGYVLYESMSVGKPLVVTDAVGATPEFVRDGVNGFVVKERGIPELADALSKILMDQILQEKMGNKSREIFKEKVNLKKQVEAFKTVIEYVKKT